MCGLSLICAALLFLQRTHRRVYWPLALFFVAETLISILTMVGLIAGPSTYPLLARLSNALTLPIAMTQAPLFWLYVRGLTSEEEHEAIAHRMLHLLPLLAAGAVAGLYLILPLTVIDGTAQVPAWVGFVIASVYAVAVLYYLQVATYIVMTIRLLTTYNSRLKDLFASTERRELGWVWWIAVAVASYWFFNIAVIVLQLSGVWPWAAPVMHAEILSQVISAALIWVIALWGLRQKPGLVRQIDDGSQDRRHQAADAAKYRNSALTTDHAERIAAKIERAMARDLMYRDPNLSLWDLAQHIGATSNYVSQTLNETLGESFFDYVNRWRIKDALDRMNTSQETILILAYDVGFNSRSSFYKAFKRETGMTPSQFRRRGKSDIGQASDALPEPSGTLT